MTALPDHDDVGKRPRATEASVHAHSHHRPICMSHGRGWGCIHEQKRKGNRPRLKTSGSVQVSNGSGAPERSWRMPRMGGLWPTTERCRSGMNRGEITISFSFSVQQAASQPRELRKARPIKCWRCRTSGVDLLSSSSPWKLPSLLATTDSG